MLIYPFFLIGFGKNKKLPNKFGELLQKDNSVKMSLR